MSRKPFIPVIVTMIVVALLVSCFFFSDKRDVDREISNREI